MLYVTSVCVPGLVFIKTGLEEITKLPNTGAASSLILMLNVCDALLESDQHRQLQLRFY